MVPSFTPSSSAIHLRAILQPEQSQSPRGLERLSLMHCSMSCLVKCISLLRSVNRYLGAKRRVDRGQLIDSSRLHVIVLLVIIPVLWACAHEVVNGDSRADIC